MTVTELFEQWKNDDFFGWNTRRELSALDPITDSKEIEDRFYRDLEFGTGGLRGIMGAGTNRMNKYTVGKATTGLAHYLIDVYGNEAKTRGVAIGYDTRNNSEHFARVTADVLSSFGIRVYLHAHARPVPQLSFTVAFWHCVAGVMITASHNPKEYNGYKVYDEHGCQLVPSQAEKVIAHVNAVDDYKSINFQGDRNLIEMADVTDNFIEAIRKQARYRNAVLNRLGGGIWMDTEVVGVPKGSGLGTSSILAAGCCKALFEFLGVQYSEDDLYSTVLCMEQIMSTGGGWQDQVGGVTDGIKYIISKPGLKQEIKVQHVLLDEKTKQELNDRFAIIYTGQRRLARNLLRDVVGRYIGNEPDTVYALNEIQRNATLQRFELERGNVDTFAALMTEHWKLSQKIDSGSTNTLIDQIFDACDDLLAGRMICGAGGGGFLQVVLKKGVTKEQLQSRLKAVFADTEIGVWDCKLV